MNVLTRVPTVAWLGAAQLLLALVAVSPQLSPRLTGETVVLEASAVDPVDPLRGAHLALSYPDLVDEDEVERTALSVEDRRRGALYVPLRRRGEVWVADGWSRERPDDGLYLACDDRGWEVRCGIDSWFLPPDEADATQQMMEDGGYAEVRVDSRGNAALVDVRESP